MTTEECERALQLGAKVVAEVISPASNTILVGEMGIGIRRRPHSSCTGSPAFPLTIA